MLPTNSGPRESALFAFYASGAGPLLRVVTGRIERKPLGNLTTGAHFAERQNFKKFVGFSGLLDIIW
jgi:hypothetical protein